MSIQRINIGQNENDGKGDSLRVGMAKVNSNFEDLEQSISSTIEATQQVDRKVDATATLANEARSTGSEALGAAQGVSEALLNHQAAEDPHPQYLTSGQSLGDGIAIFLGKLAKALRFRSVKAGTGIQIDVVNDTLVIKATGGNQGTVTSVNGKAPNASGVVTLLPSDLGALASAAQSVDSAKLGGQLPSYYAKGADLGSTNTALDALTVEVGKKAYAPSGVGPWWVKNNKWITAELADITGTLPRARLAASVVPKVAAFTKRVGTIDEYARMAVLTADGQLLVWGDAAAGLLGIGMNANVASPSRPQFSPELPSGIVITEFILSRRQMYALASNGWVYSAGENPYGELGHGDTTNRRVMTRIEYFVSNGVSIKKMFADSGRYHAGGYAYFLDGAGKVYCCGVNGWGVMGTGDRANKLTPTAIPGITGIVDVELCASQVGVAYLRNAAGDLWSAGHNALGALGSGSATETNLFAKVPGITGVKKVQVYGDYNSNASAHGNGAMALLANGDVYVTGWDGYGIAGQDTGASVTRTSFAKIPGLADIVDIGASGGYYNYAWAITRTGRLYVWGHAGQGVQGVGTNPTYSPTPTQPVGWSGNSAGDPPFIGKIVKIEAQRAAFGHQHFVLLDTDNKLWFLGHDYGRYVGEPGYIMRWAPIPLPTFLTPGEKIVDIRTHGYDGTYRLFILTDDQNLYVLGDNTNGVATAAVNRTMPQITTFQRVFA